MKHALNDAKKTSECIGITLTTVYFQVYLLTTRGCTCGLLFDISRDIHKSYKSY